MYLVCINTVLFCLIIQHSTQAHNKVTEKQRKKPGWGTDVEGGPGGPLQCSVQADYAHHFINMKEGDEWYVFTDNWICIVNVYYKAMIICVAVQICVVQFLLKPIFPNC